MPTISITIENDAGVERELKLPGHYEVCSGCEGEGKHVNPSVDEHGITAEEFAEDPDFLEAYFSGVYDVECHTCHGKRVVPQLDRDQLRMHRSGARLLARIEAAERANAEVDRIVFTSQATGTHSLDIPSSTGERVWAHLAGFIANQPNRRSAA